MAATQSSFLRNFALTCIGIGALGSSCSVYTEDLLLPGIGGIPSTGGTPNSAAGSASGAGGNSMLVAGGMTNSLVAGTTSGPITSAVAGTSNSGGAGSSLAGRGSVANSGATQGGAVGQSGGTVSGGGSAQGGSRSATGGSVGTTQGGQIGSSSSTSSTAGGRDAAGGAALNGGIAGKSTSGGMGLGGSSPGGATSTATGAGTAGRIGAGGGGFGGAAAGSAGRSTYARGGAAGGTGCEFDPTLVDDMHSVDTSILMCSGRAGHWFKFGTDSELTFGKVATDPADEAILGTKYKAKLSSVNAPQSQDCGMGFSLAESGATKNPYPLAGMKITFPYRTSGLSARAVLSVAVPVLATTPEDQGGTCTVDCYNHFSHALAPADGEWLLAEVPFVKDAPGFSQNVSWGKGLVEWLPDTALLIQFTLQGQASGDYAIEIGPINIRPAQ